MVCEEELVVLIAKPFRLHLPLGRILPAHFLPSEPIGHNLHVFIPLENKHTREGTWRLNCEILLSLAHFVGLGTLLWYPFSPLIMGSQPAKANSRNETIL